LVIACICVNAIKDSSEAIFNGTCACLTLLPAIAFWFILGMKLNKKSFSDVFTPLWLGVFIVETFLCYIFSFLMTDDYPAMATAQSVMIYLLIIMTLLVVILINQSNIETQINQRKNTNLIVPKGLQVHNARLIIVFGAVILFAMLFRNVVADVVWWLTQNTLRLIDSILQLIRMETSSPITPDGDISDSPLFDIQENAQDFTVYIVLLIAIMLIIIFRKKILLFFKSVATRIINRFSAKEIDSYENESYADYYESITEWEEKIKPESENDCLKRYKKQKDGTEKYRLGYRLYMLWLAKRNNNMNSKLTIEQHLRIAEKTYHGELDIKGISDNYTRIRYNDHTAESDELSAMDELIKELYK
ncbi:MAG: hypothetical protein IKT78_02065, partial [Ruminiclostridium sp.]|nr:hypothetical protein [Ruminiclostridium sp.]